MVEKVLYYARSSSVEKDFLLKKISLQEIVEETIKENARELIQTGVQVEMKELDQIVYADQKWMKFIITQILMNSIKYKKEDAKIVFQGEKEKEHITLHIQDNGIGIREEDVERIFEKGFTGKNGRNTNKSTGMGLYLCKKLCHKMNLSIRADSKEGEGCNMKIQFPVGSFVEELVGK
jgi:signal transduction histidine kinase